MIGMDDKIDISYTTGLFNSEINQYGFAYSMPFYDDGWKFSVNTTKTDSDIGGTAADSDVEGASRSAGGNISWSAIRQRNESLYLDAGLAEVSSSSEVLGITNTKEKLQNLTLNAVWQKTDTSGINLLSVSATKGLGISENDPSLKSRAFGSTSAASMRFTFVREQITDIDGFTIYGLANGQYAFDDVLSLGEYSAGGSTIGRGYEPAEISGEHGFAMMVEPRYVDTIEKDDWMSFGGIFDAYLLFAFADFARAYENDRNDGRGSFSESITSAGLGVRLDFLNAGTLKLTYAKPLSKDVSTYGEKKDRVLFDTAINF